MLGKTKFEIKVLGLLKVIDALIFHILAPVLGEHTLKNVRTYGVERSQFVEKCKFWNFTYLKLPFV